jgi:thiamine-phosphate diphosphorylase
VVTDDGVLARGDFEARAREVLAVGGGEVALHLRDPRTSGRRLYELAVALTPAAREAGALLLVNDRVDVALAAGTDGVHLGGRSLLPADARRLLGAGRWIGASVHDRAEAEEVAGGVDFLVVGTLYPSASHPGREGAGPGLLAGMADLRVPLVAIGGITPERVGEVRAAVAHGVAVLRGVWDSDRPEESVREYLQEWKGYDVYNV